MKVEPCAELRIIVYPGAERWAPNEAAVDKLACLLSTSATVEYVPRAQLAQIWARDHGGTPPPTNPYAFRAYSRGNRTVMFVDNTETPTSAMWLLLHELAHVNLSSAKLLCNAYRYMPRRADYLTSDAGHEAHPEEQLANQVATAMLPKLGYPAAVCDRMWWRRRQSSRLKRWLARDGV